MPFSVYSYANLPWPTDRGKTPDLIDFYIIRKLPLEFLSIEDGYDINSEHSSVYLAIQKSAEIPWPTDRGKTPNLIDIFSIRKLPLEF